jgi:transcriptional regulator
MYIPPAFAIDEPDALSMIEGLAFGALVTADLQVAPMPFLVLRDPMRLVGHVARANPIWRSGGGEAVIIIQGPNAYVSPSLYPSKAEHGRVVPTWNYEAAQVRGTAVWFKDKDRLRSLVEQLTDRFEEGQATPWAVSDAPADYLNGMLGAIVGVELEVSSIEGARKLSQNRNTGDRAGVMAGLSRSPLAKAMRR